MTNQKLIRKMFFAATLTMSTGIGSSAFAYQQYQPGEPGKQIPQGNTSVTQELNRMFQESGQPMPSMNSQDLPNANVPTQGQVRPKQPQNPPTTQAVNQPARQNTAQTRQPNPPANPPAKPGVLGKFFGKFRGDTVAKNPNYKPPVPPENNAAAPKTTNNSNTNQTAAVESTAPMAPANGQAANVPSRQGQVVQNPKTTPQSNRQSATPHQSATSNQSATAQAYHGNKPRPAQTAQPGNTPVVRNGATSQIPPRSGSTVQPVNRLNNTAAAGNGNQSKYTQPGSAPGFMQATNSSAVIKKQAAALPNAADTFDEDFRNENVNVSEVRTTVANQMQNSATPLQAASAPAASAEPNGADDGFDSPFLNDTDPIAESETLDLDSLIDIPEGPSSSDKTVAVQTAESTPAAVEEAKAAEARSAEIDAKDTENENSTESQLGPNENPFTGIQLDASDAEFFGGAEPAVPASGDSVPLAPMEDFSADLPAMDLPLDGEKAGEVPSVDLPSVDEAPADLAQPGALPGTPNQVGADLTLPSDTETKDTAVTADTAGKAQLEPIPDVPAAMSEAETEQLRQLAEQERRKQQKRLIQSRAGQTGFKGFCPVALRERRELVEADNQFTSTFGLQTYTFSSAESKAAFDAEPSRYAPAAGGSDVVVLVNSGEEQPGQLDYALWYRDRLYLFSSRETMTLFSKDPLRFASQY